MNKIIIDGYNLIHAIPELAEVLHRSLEESRDTLVRLLQSYSYRREVHMVVVFDGTFPPVGVEPPRPSGRLQIRFSRSPFKADPMIKNLIQKEKAKKSLTVVTNDMDIVRFAQTNHARAMRCAEFHELVKKRAAEATDRREAEKPEMNSDELAEWLKLFGEADRNE